MGHLPRRLIMYYDFGKLLSYSSGLLYFVIGERGVGKTFGAKKFVVNDFLKNENEFVYLRRYKTELDIAMNGFFDQLQDNGLFQDLEFKVKSSKNKVTTFTCNGNNIGYAFPLSTANILKSASFTKVKTIIFDEFLIDNGTYHYLRNEVTQFLDVIETVARLRDIRVILLGNAISTTNPYWNYFDIHLPYNSEFATFKDGLIVVNYVKNEEYRKAKKDSKFGKLVQDTEFGRYAIDNEFLRDSKSFIGKRTQHAKNFAVIVTENGQFGVWRDYREGLLFISKDFDPTNPCRVALDTSAHNENTIFKQSRSSYEMRIITEFYKIGSLYFENQSIKNRFMPTLNKCLNL